jgi:hypothetical protein
MRRSKLRAWLLLAVFFGAGTSLPGLDALLFHWHVADQHAASHVEPAGGCSAHSDHCTLGRTPPGSRAFGVLAAALRLLPALQPVLRSPPGSRWLGLCTPSLPHSRAPPALMV